MLTLAIERPDLPDHLKPTFSGALPAEYYKMQRAGIMSLVMPYTAELWKIGVRNTSQALGDKVAAIVIFSDIKDYPAFAPLGHNVAKAIGGERAAYVVPILDADEGTMQNDALKLPHVLLLLPDGKKGKTMAYPWNDWPESLFSPEDRQVAAKRLSDWAIEKLDECAEEGKCYDTLDQSKVAIVRSKTQKALEGKIQYEPKQDDVDKAQREFDDARGKVPGAPGGPPAPPEPEKGGKKKKKKKKKKSKEEL